MDLKFNPLSLPFPKAPINHTTPFPLTSRRGQHLEKERTIVPAIAASSHLTRKIHAHLQKRGGPSPPRPDIFFISLLIPLHQFLFSALLSLPPTLPPPLKGLWMMLLTDVITKSRGHLVLILFDHQEHLTFLLETCMAPWLSVPHLISLPTPFESPLWASLSPHAP